MTKLKGQSDPAKINKYNLILKDLKDEIILLIIIFYTETDIVR